MEHQPTKSQGVKGQPVTFHSLSSGIGLGTLKPPSDHVQQGKGAPAKRPQGSVVQPPRGGAAHGTTSQTLAVAGHGPSFASGPLSGLAQTPARMPEMGPAAAMTKSGKRPSLLGAMSLRLVLERFILTCGIDLLFVAITVFVVIFCSTLANYARADKGTLLTELMPLDWLLGQPRSRLLAGFFAVYLVYVVAFLVCAGGTLGAFLARAPTKHRR